MQGAALEAMPELLGHSTAEMTMRHSHLSPSVKQDADGLLDGSSSYVSATPQKKPLFPGAWWWRRRESNPGPEAFKRSFYVCSRRT